LDLHGLTLDDAKMLMHEFIREAYHLKNGTFALSMAKVTILEMNTLFLKT
jgi:hypothetical protein